jgi:hypothetical protein
MREMSGYSVGCDVIRMLFVMRMNSIVPLLESAWYLPYGGVGVSCCHGRQAGVLSKVGTIHEMSFTLPDHQ